MAAGDGKYATLAELKANIGKTADDASMGPILLAAEAAIDGFCKRPDGFLQPSTAVARVFPGTGKPYVFIHETPTITLVAVKDSPTDSAYVSWAATDWIPFTGDPKFPEFNRTPYTALMVHPTGDYDLFTSGKFAHVRGFRPDTEPQWQTPTVQVTAKWGYAATVPAQVKMAAIVQAARWWKRSKGSWSDAVQSAEFGTMLYTKALDPDVQFMLVNARLVRRATGFGY